MIMAMINFHYQKHLQSIKILDSKPFLNYSFIGLALVIIIPSIYVTNKVYESLKGQMYLLQDFNSNQFNVPINQIDALVPDIPNITVTTIPINSIKARYYFNSGKYDKALALIEKGSVANPYLYYSELLKSQIFMARGQMDSAAVYAKKAFFGLPNNALHASHYMNIINQTRDRKRLEEAYELLISKNDINNWRNYLIIASTLYPTRDKALTAKAKQALNLFPQESNIQELYRTIAIGPLAVNEANNFSNSALAFFNQSDYKNAAINFEKALELNSLEFSYFENAATANYLIGNLEKALDQINIVITEMNPLSGKSEYIKALIFIKLGDPIGACPLLKTAVDSGYSPANENYAQYCNQ
jgi:tetratricopeptide (TPR) repeat protein